MTPLAGFVLAAGLGTRIHALSATTPKPLLPVGLSTPFDRAVDALRAGGASRVVANAAHLAEAIVERGRARDVEVIVEDGGPYGTAGGLANARLDSDVAIWNGDIIADVDVRTLIDALPGASAVLAVRGREPRGKGNVGVRDGRVVRLRDQTFGDETHGAWFAAVQVLDRALVAVAPARGCLVGDLLIPALARGVVVRAIDTAGAWHDVGDLRSYLAANLAEAPLIAKTARVEVAVQRSIVGEGAVVTGSGSIDRVVVFPHARAVAPLSSCIVTRTAVIPVEGIDAVA
jgi:NDP-sugar pyrophosphorylase family protein